MDWLRLASAALLTIALSIRLSDRRLVRRLRQSGAISEATAAPLHTRHPLARWRLGALTASRVIGVAPRGHYLREDIYAVHRRTRRKRGLAIAGTLLASLLAYWQFRTRFALDPQLPAAAAKLILPILSITLVAFVVTARRLSWREDLGVRAPSGISAMSWLLLWIAWMLGTNAAMQWRGPWDFAPWQALPWSVIVFSVLAVGVLGPLAEELIFRGLLLWRLRAWVGSVAAVVLIAVGWAAVHVDYSLPIVALLAGSGVILGTARVRSGSVLLPAAMHIIWNLYAIW